LISTITMSDNRSNFVGSSSSSSSIAESNASRSHQHASVSVEEDGDDVVVDECNESTKCGNDEEYPYSSFSSPASFRSALQEDASSALWLLDGGTGEELFRLGLVDENRQLWSVAALVQDDYHGLLLHVHRNFLRAGCRCVTTNSYGITSTLGLTKQERFQYARISGRLARQAVREHERMSSTSTIVFVMGSLGPMVESYRPDLILPRSQGIDAYRPLVRGLYPWVDAFMLETMGSVEEATQAMEAIAIEHIRRKRPRAAPHHARCEGASMPVIDVWVSFTLGSDGRLRDGMLASDAFASAMDAADKFCDQGLRLSSLLFNCCEPEAITAALRQIHEGENPTHLWGRLQRANVRLGAYANRLTAVAPDWTFEGSSEPQSFRTDLDPNHYGDVVWTWIKEYHVTVIGGCCGITPDHIAHLHSRFIDDSAR
jgi:S-methylmethionine-dependent homocysteine/selenocysteine methylase